MRPGEMGTERGTMQARAQGSPGTNREVRGPPEPGKNASCSSRVTMKQPLTVLLRMTEIIKDRENHHASQKGSTNANKY